MLSIDRRPGGGTLRRANAGVGLVEVLVTVLVLSIGLLGVAGLQATGLRQNHDAFLRTQATVLAYDIIDRMRANQLGAQGGNYDNQAGAEQAACMSTSNPGCSPAAMAQNDVFEWNAGISRSLPSGQGVVCIDSTPGDGTPAAPGCDAGGLLYTVKLWWDDDRDGDTDPKRFVTVFQP